MISKILKILFFIVIFIAGAGTSAYLTLTWIIKSEATVVVPALKGKEVVYALQVLSDLGLNTRIKSSRYSADIPTRHVIAQDPSPGSEIKQGRNVRLVISKGQRALPIPQLTGLPLRQALLVLEENGLCPGTRARSKHADLQPDIIIAQSPSPGVIINRDVCVDLLISSGPYQDAFVMSNLTTLPVDDAILKIEAGNLKLGNITTAAARGLTPNAVAGQTPLAGHRVVAGQRVHLSVNRIRDGGGQSGKTVRPQTWFLRHQTGSGFLNKHITIRMSSRIFSYDLYDDFMPPASELIFLIPRFENVAVMLYEDGELIKTIFPGR